MLDLLPFSDLEKACDKLLEDLRSNQYITALRRFQCFMKLAQNFPEAITLGLRTKAFYIAGQCYQALINRTESNILFRYLPNSYNPDFMTTPTLAQLRQQEIYFAFNAGFFYSSHHRYKKALEHLQRAQELLSNSRKPFISLVNTQIQDLIGKLSQLNFAQDSCSLFPSYAIH